MNYKAIIPSRDLRVRILSALSWVPDRLMLKLQYRIHTGRKLNLNEPTRFTEKIQAYKLKYRNPDMLRCTDKFEVRKFVAEKGCGEILIPMIGVYKSAEDIDFSVLPDKFVAKTTDGGGGNQVLLCRDKSLLSEREFKQTLSSWMSMPKKRHVGREWAYENGFPRRIVIENLIEDGSDSSDLIDYKFYCFNGRPMYCQVIANRRTHETIDFYDMHWNHMPFRGLNKECDNADRLMPAPCRLSEMEAIAARLSSEFPFARVDLYSTPGQVFFGEITFYPASGFGHFTPDEWDEKLGTLMHV